MPEQKKRVLIVDDKKVNLQILRHIIDKEYDVLEAEDGVEAFQILEKERDVDAILLDIVMPRMNGYEFLEKIKTTRFRDCPIIVLTGAVNGYEERHALEAGAWDFAPKPYNQQVLLCRLRNAIARSELAALKQINYIVRFNPITGIYNKTSFMEETKKLLLAFPEERFALVRMDINHFSLINSFYGIEAGDALLRFLANAMKAYSKNFSKTTYGHMEGDVFAFCVPYESEDILLEHLSKVVRDLKEYPIDFNLEPAFGIFLIDDIDQPVFQMLDYAHMAAKSIKGNVLKSYEFFKPRMKEELLEEQQISNRMNDALNNEEFCVYLQPKCDIRTGCSSGAEALVRWNSPNQGLVSPGRFIPIFEKNGFIAKLDYYMWERVCMLLQSWIVAGKSPNPISVNISRISIFDPHIVEKIIGLVKKYEIPVKLFHLEITESAYMAEPQRMKDVVKRLRDYGFIILMDDFGSGYSSLNTLKDIDVDILKIDMKFLPNGKNNVKSEKILTSVARMAGWLGMAVIVEGVETKEQLDFLKSIGCGYIQGYYFARPMPAREYEEKYLESSQGSCEVLLSSSSRQTSEAVWSSSQEFISIMNGMQVPFAIYEYTSHSLEAIRTNERFRQEFGYAEQKMEEEEQARLYSAFDEARQHESAEKDCRILGGDGTVRMYRVRIQSICESENGRICGATFLDISAEMRLEHIVGNIFGKLETGRTQKKEQMLVVDDSAVSRAIAKNVFKSRFDIWEAEDGAEAIELLREMPEKPDIILLDLFMPNMDGTEFLLKKKEQPELADIPVVIISTENSAASQLKMLKYGVNDYVIKPFVPEILKRRVENVMEYSSRFEVLVREYNKEYKNG